MTGVDGLRSRLTVRRTATRYGYGDIYGYVYGDSPLCWRREHIG
jgi:hypothetical protein